MSSQHSAANSLPREEQSPLTEVGIPSPVLNEQTHLTEIGDISPLLGSTALSIDGDIEMIYTSLDSLPPLSVVGSVPPTPVPTVPSAINSNTSSSITLEMLLASAKEDLSIKKNNFYVAYANYVALSKVNPMSDAARHASSIKKEAQELFEDAQKTLKVLEKANAPPAILEDKKSMVVPSNLPFLQLCTETRVKQNRDVFDSVYDFCQEFTMVLESHSLSLDSCWERLLPICLNKEERSWFEDKLKGKAYKRFLNMGRVWKMMQKKGESVRAFGAKFQTARRQASLEDGIQMVLCFWWNLRPEVREASLIPLSANYGTKLPSKVEDIISLVSVATSDSTALLNQPAESGTPAKWKSFSDAHSISSSISHKGKKRAIARDNDPKHAKKSWNFKKAIKDNVCFSCKGAWEKGHTCPERDNYLTKVSRMAVRSPADRSVASSPACGGFPPSRDSHFSVRGNSSPVGSSSTSWLMDQDNTSALAKMALNCKDNHKDMIIKKDFKNMSTNITFSILANNSIRTIALLDCGATFSSVDKNFCLQNKISINYVNHINKDLVNNSNVHKYFIRLADSNTHIKRIGTCVISITCNSKTIQREFEVMNLTNSYEYDFSIGTDYMSTLGIGIYGLPLSYDDADSSKERREADRCFNNKSDLLESIERENEQKENNPAVGPKQFEDAMDYICPFIKDNQDIPKGSFCTIPESVVCLDTPENATAFRSPYPIPYKMQGVVDEQEYWQRIGEAPESIKDINKANKRLLKDMKVVNSIPKEKSGIKRKNYAKTALQKKKRSKV
ncbi:hypothetical protein PHYBLDRAFT_173945 [Phycomyces blakesleeanus NRRL 1555(-)]|uniref:Uncharacterized protein n=1 Tax=Phycomyces blakesleeanus (strain ATCC 8743b / DSM 1359 / FGSC 10004 / NBRC 33097 / NRRL 1555) TaxID=763407 RepID=A0A162TJF4_PHYB8|nr:hypothetical protein PHYBLDRAFT_173945 [Phycomyces blakesleeanus NRRL 1555(-)]OAD67613.1 hypothetical protein PHYBLDRAFT_173945 [Phycomyces blakesleeanus NRRL 1555(-)]|eukprot:XP_018285653.1 hypothetical protein PHYBLDRAFT_173945 [Phycomyces blakesleeanus NRRL 1555(-)]